MIYWLILSAVGLGAVALTIHAARNWQGDRYLCDDCLFNSPEQCLKTERPKALSCLAYKKK